MFIRKESNLTFKIVSNKYHSHENEIIDKYIAEYTYLLDYLKKHSVLNDMVNEPENLEIIIRDKMYNISQDGGVLDDNTILIFGYSNDDHILSHELIHLLIPSKHRAYDEGLADYIPDMLYKEKGHCYWKGINKKDMLLSHLNNRYAEKYASYYEFFKDYSNLKALNLSRIPLAHSLCCLFVDFLIDTIGFEEYFKDFHCAAEIDRVKESIYFDSFFSAFKNDRTDYSCFDDYFQKVSELSKQGEALKLKYSIEDKQDLFEYSQKYWYYFTEKERTEVEELRKKELARFNNPLDNKIVIKGM